MGSGGGGVTMFVPSVRRAAVALAAFFLLCFFVVAPKAQTAPANPPQKVEDLLKLLSDPEVQKWLEAQKTGTKPAITTQPGNDITFDVAFERMRSHLAALAQAIPRLPSEIARVAGQIRGELQGYGLIRLF